MNETTNNSGEPPVWDQSGLEKRVRGKTDRMVKLIKLYLADMPARMNELSTQIEQERMQEVRDVAHTIKGVCGNLGMIRLQNAASELEVAVQDADQENISKLVPIIKAEYNKSADLLQDFVDTHS